MMEKVKLSKEEKILLRALKDKEKDTPLLTEGQKYLCARSLERKGLVDVRFNYDKIDAIKISYEGKAYLQVNPSLRNPFDWHLVEVLFMGITALATFLALFISCTLLTK